MTNIQPLIDKLEGMEADMRTIDRLYSTGLIRRFGRRSEAGDWDVHLWSHSADRSFTVGSMQRARKDGKPFPWHAHDQKLWLLCSSGSFQVVFDDGSIERVEEGGYLVVEQSRTHAVEALTAQCVVVFVMIPADEGYCGCGEIIRQ